MPTALKRRHMRAIFPTFTVSDASSGTEENWHAHGEVVIYVGFFATMVVCVLLIARAFD